MLNPASPVFREVRALLAEDPSLRDTGLQPFQLLKTTCLDEASDPA